MEKKISMELLMVNTYNDEFRKVKARSRTAPNHFQSLRDKTLEIHTELTFIDRRRASYNKMSVACEPL